MGARVPIKIFAILLITVGMGTMVYAQCAMCVTGLTNSAEGQQMARSFNTAILYLLPFPYLIALFIGGIILNMRARQQGMTLVEWLKRKWHHRSSSSKES